MGLKNVVLSTEIRNQVQKKKVSLRVLKYADMFRRVIVSTDMNSRVQNNGNVTSAEVCKLAQSQTRFFATEVWQ